MRKSIQLAMRVFAAMLMLGIAGCGGGNSAKGIAKKCVDCLQDADFESMRQMSTGGMIAWIDRAERKYDEIGKLLGEKVAVKFKKTYGKLKCKVVAVPGDGDKVTVLVKINGQDTPLTLIKVGGKWRVEKFDFPII